MIDIQAYHDFISSKKEGVKKHGFSADSLNSHMKKHQKQQVLRCLKRGNTITHLEAIDWFGCSRLSSVILRLRKDGHDIQTTLIPTADCPTGYARYSLIKDAGK